MPSNANSIRQLRSGSVKLTSGKNLSKVHSTKLGMMWSATVSKHTGKHQREERALRLLKLLLAQEEKALLEDFNPCCWRVSCKLSVEFFQDAILLSDNLLNCPRSVQRGSAMRLAPGEESGKGRQHIGQWASRLLKTWSWRWIHLNQDVDCGSQREDIENVDVIVFPFGPPVRSRSSRRKSALWRRRSAVAAKSRRR